MCYFILLGTDRPGLDIEDLLEEPMLGYNPGPWDNFTGVFGSIRFFARSGGFVSEIANNMPLLFGIIAGVFSAVTGYAGMRFSSKGKDFGGFGIFTVINAILTLAATAALSLFIGIDNTHVRIVFPAAVITLFALAALYVIPSISIMKKYIPKYAPDDWADEW